MLSLIKRKNIVKTIILTIAVIATAYASLNWGIILGLLVGCSIAFLLEPFILKVLKL